MPMIFSGDIPSGRSALDERDRHALVRVHLAQLDRNVKLFEQLASRFYTLCARRVGPKMPSSPGPVLLSSAASRTIKL